MKHNWKPEKDSRQKRLKTYMPSELEMKARSRKGLDGQAYALQALMKNVVIDA